MDVNLVGWVMRWQHTYYRYDVRGALSELAPHEPPPGGYGNRLDYLSADEQRAEQLCEEERYLYLYNNEEDHILQQEEDLKRLKQDIDGGDYAQVDFQYGNAGLGAVPHGPNREGYSDSPIGEEAEQAFSLPKGFEVPPNIHLPETMKQHAIIEKTARFIASQGMQMEILLKAKQSNNVQFEFLAINGALNPYYKYILNAIKNGSYPAESTTLSPKEAENEQTAMNGSEFTASLLTKPIIAVPTIKYKPSANCAYTQLISKIKGVPLPAVIDGELANFPSSDSPTPTTTTANQNFTPVLLQYNDNTYVPAECNEEAGNSNSNSQMKINGAVRTEVELLKTSSALTLAQDYASDTESETEEQQQEQEPEQEVRMKTPPPPKFEPILNFPVPTETLKNIIDKTASYVIKNGRQFEETLRAKSVDRFTFLLYDNEHYPYYLYKVTGDPDAASKEQKQRKAAAVAAALMSKKKLLLAEKSISPVCFSIKAKDDAPAMLQPALPREASDDDEEPMTVTANNGNNSIQMRTVPEHVQKAIQLVESQLMARNAQIAATIGNRNLSNGFTASSTALLGMRAPSNQSTSGRFDIDYNSGATGSTSTKTHLKISKAEMERNALFEQQQQNRQKELKKAEEKVKDKLAKIAREKLGGPLSKEKQLQLERKRKAMAFLNQIKDSPSAANSGKNSPTDVEKANTNMSDSDESVHSIPITSYGPEDDGKSDIEQRLIEIPTTHIAGETSNLMLVMQATAVAMDELQSKPDTTTVNVSDDDDIELVGVTKPISNPTKLKQRHTMRKRQLRSRTLDSSGEATPKSNTKHVHKRKYRRRRSCSRSPSRSNSESSGDEESSYSSDSRTSSSYSSSSTATSSASSSDDSTDNEMTERSSHSRRSLSHRKRKSGTKATKKSKKQRSSKSKKSSSRSRRKKSKKHTHNEEDYKNYKEHERRRSRTHKHHKRRYEQKDQILTERRSKKADRQRSPTSAHREVAYQYKRDQEHAQQMIAIEEAARREYEYARQQQERDLEREREREYRQRHECSQRDSKQRDREREHRRERDRSNSSTHHYDAPLRKEKKKSMKREH